MSESSSNHFNHDNHLNHVIAPDRPVSAGGTQVPENGNGIDPNKGKKLRNRLIGAGVVAVIGVTGVVVGVNVAKSQGSKPPEATKTSAPANPTEAPTTTPETGSFETIVIPLNATPEQIGQAVTDVMNAQYDKNLTPAASEAVVNDKTGATPKDILHGLATKTVTNVFDAQYITGWANNGKLKGVHDFIADRNTERLLNYTSGQTLTDSFAFDSATVVGTPTAEQTVIDITTTESYNNPNDPVNTEKLNGNTSTERYTLIPQGDRLVISDQQLNP